MSMGGIKESIFKFLKLESLVENLSGYVESRVELVKLEIREDVARLLSKSIVYAALMLFAFLFLIFFSIGLAQYINTFFEASFAGYWIIALIYAITFFVFLLFRKSMLKNFEKHFTEMIRRKEK
jgi:uncharacterized membrane protein YqjE